MFQRGKMLMPKNLLLGEHHKRLVVRVPDWLYEWISKKARKEGVEKSKVVRRILLEAMRRETGGG